MQTRLLLVWLLGCLILQGCSKEKKGCTYREAVNFDPEAVIKTECNYVSDHMSGRWIYVDSFELTLRDSLGQLYTTQQRDSGAGNITRIDNETVKLISDSLADYTLKLSWYNKLTYNISSHYLIDTIYSGNLMCFRHYYHPTHNYKKEGRVWLIRN